jgi:hypothetical protein
MWRQELQQGEEVTMRQVGVYTNQWGQRVQIPFGDMYCGNVSFTLPDYTITIDFYGDRSRVECWTLTPKSFKFALEDIQEYFERLK